MEVYPDRIQFSQIEETQEALTRRVKDIYGCLSTFDNNTVFKTCINYVDIYLPNNYVFRVYSNDKLESITLLEVEELIHKELNIIKRNLDFLQKSKNILKIENELFQLYINSDFSTDVYGVLDNELLRFDEIKIIKINATKFNKYFDINCFSMLGLKLISVEFEKDNIAALKLSGHLVDKKIKFFIEECLKLERDIVIFEFSKTLFRFGTQPITLSTKDAKEYAENKETAFKINPSLFGNNK